MTQPKYETKSVSSRGGIAQSPERLPAWSHTVKHEDPSFKPHQCLLAGTWKKWFSYHTGHQEVSRCHTSSRKCTLDQAHPLRGDIQKGFWPHKNKFKASESMP